MSTLDDETRARALLEAETLRPSLALADLTAPAFDRAGRICDWRNYVPDAVRAMWDTLPLLTRAAVYVTAQAGASAEEWD